MQDPQGQSQFAPVQDSPQVHFSLQESLAQLSVDSTELVIAVLSESQHSSFAPAFAWQASLQSQPSPIQVSPHSH